MLNVGDRLTQKPRAIRSAGRNVVVVLDDDFKKNVVLPVYLHTTRKITALSIYLSRVPWQAASPHAQTEPGSFLARHAFQGQVSMTSHKEKGV